MARSRVSGILTKFYDRKCNVGYACNHRKDKFANRSSIAKSHFLFQSFLFNIICGAMGCLEGSYIITVCSKWNRSIVQFLVHVFPKMLFLKLISILFNCNSYIGMTLVNGHTIEVGDNTLVCHGGTESIIY